MRKLSLNILFLFLVICAVGQESPHGQTLAIDCASCHTTQNWKYIATSGFDHDSTRFQLEGQHEQTNCAACHTSLVFSEANTQCINCHNDMHNTTVGSDCALCHNANSWIVSNVTELHQQSRFPLLGAHNAADCILCHTSASRLEFEPLGVECVDCHLQDYLATTNPNHAQTELSTDCIECHEIDAFDWTASQIGHSFFPLVQGHAISDCTACHTSDIGEPISSECYSCHMENYIAAENHVLQGVPLECEQCHTIATWEESTFYHSSTNFPLTGAHTVTECDACHENGYVGTPVECSACHASNYNNAQDPNHTAAGISTECQTCHETTDWVPSTFDHMVSTGFELTGGHDNRQCSDCHKGTTSGASSECISCHSVNYNEAQNPNHTAAGISTLCETCHTTSTWVPSTFDHFASTGFELSGGHAGRQCSDCHKGTTSGADSDCISCHQDNYNAARNHIAQNFPFDCLICHNTNAWVPSTFDHNTTNFPLTGAHRATECIACHSEGYEGISSLCIDCHQIDYNNTTNPNHAASGISVQCEECHSTGPGWTPALFPDHQDYYVLKGAHTAIANDCFLCHSGNYNNTPNTCYECHTTDYNSARDPNHLSAQFSTDCEFCHTETAWEPSSFDHDSQYFPIYSGKHRREWNTCLDCHIESSNFSAFSCTTCHEHNQVIMAVKHLGNTDYSFDSQSCLECHPTGEADD